MKKIFLGLMACAALCACTSDDVLVNNLTNSEVKDGLYMQFKLEMPSTRSATEDNPVDGYVASTDGIEYGKDYENNVQTLMVVLTDENDNYITKAKEYSGSSSTYYVATFEAAEIEDYASQKVEVHVYCNTPESYDGKDVDAIYNGDPETAWATNAFFMSNAKELEVELPSDFTPYKDISTPYPIGTVYVERSVARMDYKDGSATSDFTYPMMVDEDTQNAQINLVISEMALINMSNSFYYLRHMAASTDDSDYSVANLDAITLLTAETNLNWVIDTDAETKMEYDGTDLSDNFTYPLQHPGKWEWTKMNELDEADNDETWNSEGSKGDYNIWRYLTENTIPSIEAQLNGITTGVVFKAEIQPTEYCDADLANAFDSGERIFAYANEIVGTWEMVAAFAEENPTTALAAAYRNVMGQFVDAGEPDPADVSAAQAAEGFTGYSPDDEGNYYCYYYYWNRHNDNLQNGVMGTMEFDVVRNNVYKLSVTGISLFGHPTPTDSEEPGNDPDPDPDPVNPDDPDEDNNIYIQVTVEILPWVVRVNDITF